MKNLILASLMLAVSVPAFAKANLDELTSTIERNLSVELATSPTHIKGYYGYCTIDASLVNEIPRLTVQKFDANMDLIGTGAFPQGPTDNCQFIHLSVNAQAVLVARCSQDGTQDLVVGETFVKVSGYVCDFKQSRE